MRIWCVVLSVVLAFAGTISADDILVEYKSRTSPDKVNFFYWTENFELFTLKTSNLEVEAGPRLRYGPLTVTPRLGVIWRLSDNTPYAQAAIKVFFKQGRWTALCVGEFSLEGSGISKQGAVRVYSEGFIVANLGGSLSRFEAGVCYESYRPDGGNSIWVAGPRFNLMVGTGYFKKVSLWTGLTDNPTAYVSFFFGCDL